MGKQSAVCTSFNHSDASPPWRNISTKKYMRGRSGKVEKLSSALPVVQGNLFFLEDHQNPVERGKDEREPRVESCQFTVYSLSPEWMVKLCSFAIFGA